MPTYSYRCPKCGRVFDIFHSMSNNDPQHCPECGAEGKKLLSASSVIFKGSGFYSTDYRDSGYLEAKKAEKEDSTNKAESKEKGNQNTKKTENTETKKVDSSSKSPALTTKAA